MIYPGLKIGDYIIEDELGRGGFGSVYLARDERSGQNVAVKFLHPKSLKSDAAQQAFVDEMINQARLSLTPNIVHVIRSIRYKDNQGEHPGMVMEYVDGDPLDLFIHRFGLLPEYLVIPILLQVLNGLEFAHRHNLLHRDIKPGNIIVGRNGLIKIMDFGLSKVVAGSTAASESARAASLNYVAPERLEKQSIDQRTDLYSVGATFYESLTGKPPYDIEAGNWADAKAKHRSGRFSGIREACDAHSVALDGIIRKALDPDPAKRFGNCREMMQRLLEIWIHAEVPPRSDPAFQQIVDVTRQVLGGAIDGFAQVGNDVKPHVHTQPAYPPVRPPSFFVSSDMPPAPRTSSTAKPQQIQAQFLHATGSDGPMTPSKAATPDRLASTMGKEPEAFVGIDNVYVRMMLVGLGVWFAFTFFAILIGGGNNGFIRFLSSLGNSPHFSNYLAGADWVKVGLMTLVFYFSFRRFGKISVNFLVFMGIATLTTIVLRPPFEEFGRHELGARDVEGNLFFLSLILGMIYGAFQWVSLQVFFKIPFWRWVFSCIVSNGVAFLVFLLPGGAITSETFGTKFSLSFLSFVAMQTLSLRYFDRKNSVSFQNKLNKEFSQKKEERL